MTAKILFIRIEEAKMNRSVFILTLCACICIVHAKNSKLDDRGKTRKKRIGDVLSAVIAGAISVGTSMATTTIDAALDSTGKPLSLGLVVENWTKWILRDPTVYLRFGHVSKPPRRVLPSQEELMVTHETGSGYGSGGVLSYYIREIDRRIYIMWQVTNNQGAYSNWLGVGIDKKNKNYKFNDMYYGTPTTFVRAKYWDDVKQVRYTAHGITVEGAIGSAKKCKAAIIVKPTSKANLAKKVKEVITELL